MANALFANAKGLLLDAGVNLGSATSKLDLIDTADDNPNVSTDDYYDDIAAGAAVSTVTLSGVSTTAAGVMDATDPTFTAVTGDPVEESLLWVDTGGASSTDPLIASYDTFSAGMPLTPNSGDVDYAIHANGLFAL